MVDTVCIARATRCLQGKFRVLISCRRAEHIELPAEQKIIENISGKKQVKTIGKRGARKNSKGGSWWAKSGQPGHHSEFLAL